MILLVLFVAVFFLAWANGANDNFKGVATLYGSATATFRQALVWATAATLAGSLVSVAFAASLARSFSGKGLLSADVITPSLLAAVAVAGALTILAATRLGMPTSTTHALTGALVGAGLAAAGSTGVGWPTLATRFAQPLIVSPLLAIAGAASIYPLFRFGRRALGVERQTCLCVGESELVPLGAGVALAEAASALAVELGEAPECVERYSGRVFGVRAQPVVDVLHYASGGAVCFARAVNDTPKVAALLFGALALGARLSATALVLVAFAMAAGGWLGSRRVAETMSKHITELNPGQGLTANLVTAALVLGASRLGVPVSTTHVSCGSIFGIGLVNGKRDWRVINQILATWLTTLPLALLLGAGSYLALAAIA